MKRRTRISAIFSTNPITFANLVANSNDNTYKLGRIGNKPAVAITGLHVSIKINRIQFNKIRNNG